MTVFLIDDDPSVRRALARLIKSAGYQVESFGSVTGTPGLSASYIVFKLDPVFTGSGPINYDLTVSLRGVTSNSATLTIIP